MKSTNEARKLVDLGKASEQTLGADGYSLDFVRELPITGLASD